MANKVINLPEGVPALRSYYIYMTGGCNLACKHCYLAPKYQPHGTTGGHIDFELFKLAIDEGIPLGLGHVKLTGGEPLLHPDFTRIVDYLRENEIQLAIETNGILMNERIARFLKEKSTLTHISISLDGATAETHDAMRGVKGSFERSTRAVRQLADAGIPAQIIMTIHDGNVDEIEELIKVALSIGARNVKFNLLQPTGRGETMHDRGYGIDIARLIEVGRWVEGDLQKRTPIPLLYDWPMAFHSLKRLQRYSGTSCGIFGILGLLATGEMAMCGVGTQVDELVYGKLGVDRVADVWANNAMLMRLRRELPENLHGVCKDCVFKKECLGHCVAGNYFSQQDLSASFWFCDQAYKSGLFPVSRLVNAGAAAPVGSI